MRIGTTEIFDIPIGDCVGLPVEDVSILYSPLQDEIIVASAEDVRCIKSYLEQDCPIDEETKDLIDNMTVSTVPKSCSVPNILSFTKLSLLPNYICNFACSYCYSSTGRSNQEIDWAKVQSVLDYFIDDKRISLQPLSLFISGGGEPLASWGRITQRSVEYARLRAEEKGFSLSISIITNGSLLTKNIASVLADYDCSVCVSFEVLDELQNKQRGGYDKVHKNIQLLGQMGIPVLLNSTITPLSVIRMEEMITTVADYYPFVRQYTMEPVTGKECFSSREALREFYDQFYKGYLAAKKVARERGIRLHFTFDDALSDTTVRHCPGKFTLTPQGTFSVCHLASSPQEERYDKCIYGEVAEDGKIWIDKQRFEQLFHINLFSYEMCEDCFARWSCGGECMMRRDTYPSEYMEEVCRFNKRFIRHLLVERLERSVQEERNQSLKEYVRQ